MKKHRSIKNIEENKKLWKTTKSFFSNESNNFKNISLIENGKHVTDDFKIEETFNKYFQNLVPNLDLKVPSDFRSTRLEVFLVKGVLKICCKFTGEHPCRNVISIKLQSNFIEIALRHGCSPVNLQHIFRTPFSKIWMAASAIYTAKHQKMGMKL